MKGGWPVPSQRGAGRGSGARHLFIRAVLATQSGSCWAGGSKQGGQEDGWAMAWQVRAQGTVTRSARWARVAVRSTLRHKPGTSRLKVFCFWAEESVSQAVGLYAADCSSSLTRGWGGSAGE